MRQASNRTKTSFLWIYAMQQWAALYGCGSSIYVYVNLGFWSLALSEVLKNF